MEPTPAIPSPALFDLSGQHVLITGASRGQSYIRPFTFSRSLICQIVPIYSRAHLVNGGVQCQISTKASAPHVRSHLPKRVPRFVSSFVSRKTMRH